MGYRKDDTQAQNMILELLHTIPDEDVCTALSNIIFNEEVASINWRRAAAVLWDYLPERYGAGFLDTITYQQLSDYLEAQGETEDEDFLRWLQYEPNSSPEDAVPFDTATETLYRYFAERFTDSDYTENHAAATAYVRSAFKKYSFY